VPQPAGDSCYAVSRENHAAEKGLIPGMGHSYCYGILPDGILLAVAHDQTGDVLNRAVRVSSQMVRPPRCLR